MYNKDVVPAKPKDMTLLDIYPDRSYSAVIVSRIWNKIKRRLVIKNGCWEYGGFLNLGYGRISIKMKGQKVFSISTHKFVFRYFRGEVGEYELIRHMCNNKRCCNPAHLEKGSFLDNALDIIRSRKNV